MPRSAPRQETEPSHEAAAVPSSPDVLNLMMTNDKCHDVMMLPDGRDTGGRPGQDDPEVDEGEAGEEAVNMQRKCHHIY